MTLTNQSTLEYLDAYEIIWTREVIFRVTTLVIVMFFTLLGNWTLIYMIMCYPRQRRKRVNIFLVNLAVGDLMVCLFTMTTEILFVAFGKWVLGAAACKLIVYGQIVTIASATFLLTGMSIDRYQVLVQPLRSLAGRPRILNKVLTAWIAAFVFAVPQLFIFVQTDEGVYSDGSVKHLCRSQGYTARWQRKLYFTFLTTYILIIPFFIMSFCYINIIRVVWKRTDSGPDEPRLKIRFLHNRQKSQRSNSTTNGSALNQTASQARRHGRLTIPKKLVSSSKRKVVKMTLSVIIGFLICETPYFVIGLIRIFSDYQIKLTQALNVAEVMTLVHSALNPVLYGIFSTKMSIRALLRYLPFCTPPRPAEKSYDFPSEDETTWTELRRFSMELRGDYTKTPCWKRVLCPCCVATQPPTYNNTTVEYYQELLPNGTAQERPHAETDSSDTEVATERGSPRSRDRHVVSLVLVNRNTEGPQSVSAL